MTNNFGISDSSYTLIKKELSIHPEIEKIIIFGSRAMGNFKTGSDIDLALYGKKISAQMLLDLSAILNEKLPIPYKIDLIHFDSLENQELKAHILRVGQGF
ncbi:MAG: nucleotidyltransferase family protein [Bacteroidota bacterium]